ncbi:ATP-binding protein, partial [Candidatus Pacearchaeota archaeon]|nr:ATP-binding protein [Candidatus Pacearchaeota archaeon]
MKIKVEVKNDFLQRIANNGKPLLAVSEFIWNGFDADAHNVKIYLSYNALNHLDEIRIVDNGHGISFEDAKVLFGSLGGSWKIGNSRSKSENRILHGKAGRGRFCGFSLGSRIEWQTAYKKDNEVYSYSIIGERREIGTFEITDEKKLKGGHPGTVVIITDVLKNFTSLGAEKAVDEIAMLFALYLRQYPDVKLTYDGFDVDTKSFELKDFNFSIQNFEISNSRKINLDMTVIEWKKPLERNLYLCDESGFALEKMPPGIQAYGFNFTVYLMSSYLKELADSNSLMLHDLHQDLGNILNEVRKQLKEYFRKRSSQEAMSQVEEWKKANIYPFRDEPQNILEQTERQVFDVCALSLNEYLPDFEKSSLKNKQMTLFFLKQAIETGPEALQNILQEVLELPKEKQEELSEMLKKTTLTAIINASKEIADRLSFLKGLEELIFNEDIRDNVLERQQLHKILENQTWIFGEEFRLSNSDESLTTVLSKHLKKLGQETAALEKVIREDGREGIVDLQLSRSIPQSKPAMNEYLVVELKRPSVKINNEILNQIESYALAVSNDERFKDTQTTWIFYVIARDMTDESRKKANQRGRTSGITYEDRDLNLTVWAKSWGQIIEECRGKL